MSQTHVVVVLTHMKLGQGVLLGSFLLTGCGSSAVVLQGGDAGSDADAALPVEAGVDSGAMNVGVVTLTSKWATVGAAIDEARVSAGFSLNPTSGCPETIVDGCSLIDCQPPFPSPTMVSAGTVVITGGKQPVTMTPSGTDYGGVGNLSHLWDGGEVLQVVAAGDTAPAFNLSVIAPPYVVVSEPAWPSAGGTLTIPRSQPLVVSWTGGNAGSVEVHIRETLGTRTLLALCKYSAQKGTGTVGTALLAAFPTTTANQTNIEIVTTTGIGSTKGTWLFQVNAVALGTAATGPASANFAFQ